MDDPKKTCASEAISAPARPDLLPAGEKERLLEVLKAAREIVEPTVRRLKESEGVSHDLLSRRLDKST
jgi:hypothetical protein